MTSWEVEVDGRLFHQSQCFKVLRRFGSEQCILDSRYLKIGFRPVDRPNEVFRVSGELVESLGPIYLLWGFPFDVSTGYFLLGCYKRSHYVPFFDFKLWLADRGLMLDWSVLDRAIQLYKLGFLSNPARFYSFLVEHRFVRGSLTFQLLSQKLRLDDLVSSERFMQELRNLIVDMSHSFWTLFSPPLSLGVQNTIGWLDDPVYFLFKDTSPDLAVFLHSLFESSRVGDANHLFFLRYGLDGGRDHIPIDRFFEIAYILSSGCQLSDLEEDLLYNRIEEVSVYINAYDVLAAKGEDTVFYHILDSLGSVEVALRRLGSEHRWPSSVTKTLDRIIRFRAPACKRVLESILSSRARSGFTRSPLGSLGSSGYGLEFSGLLGKALLRAFG